MEVLYDGVKSVKVISGPEVDGKTCGICGNSDGTMDDDDLVKGPHVSTEECAPYAANLSAYDKVRLKIL